ncbi:MAG: DUF6111 family protein [Beijerinckiaceae bacterium]
MIRVVIEALLFLVVPFMMFAVWLIARRQPIISRESWEGHGGWLTIAGLALVVVMIIYGGLAQRRSTGEYVPAHMENGKLVPGRMQ